MVSTHGSPGGFRAVMDTITRGYRSLAAGFAHVAGVLTVRYGLTVEHCLAADDGGRDIRATGHRHMDRATISNLQDVGALFICQRALQKDLTLEAVLAVKGVAGMTDTHPGIIQMNALSLGVEPDGHQGACAQCRR